MGGWKYVRLSGGKILNYEDNLIVAFNSEHSLVLIGDAWSVKNMDLTPYDFVCGYNKDISVESVLLEEINWCGRYCLIVNNVIYTDSAALLQVFYDERNVSSNVHLLCEADNLKINESRIIHGIGPDFLPGTMTSCDDVRRLLPSESFDLNSNKRMPRKILTEGIPSYSSNLVQEFCSYFTQSLINMRSYFPQSTIWLALTGGKDSRTLMSLLENSGIEYKTFTLEHSNISHGDIEIPRLLAKQANREHLYILQKKKDKKLEEKYTSFTSGMAVDQGRNFYSCGQYDELLMNSSDVIVLRSGIWEFSTEYFFGGDKSKTDINDLEEIFPLLKVNDKMRSSINEWLNTIKADSLNSDLTLDERLYLEIRVACWLASGEQGFDLMKNITSVQPLNSRKLLSMLLAFPLSARVRKEHEDLIIKYACKGLCDIPYDKNVKNNIPIARKLKKKISKCIDLVSYYGIQNAIKIRRKV